MYAAINQFAPDAALAIFTGDIVEGDTWETTDASNQFDITDAYARMRKLALPGVFPAVGNHESSPVNQFALEGDAVPANISTQWVFDTLAASWAPFLPPSTVYIFFVLRPIARPRSLQHPLATNCMS